MTVDEKVSLPTQWIQEQWPDLEDGQVAELEQVWLQALPPTGAVPGWLTRGFEPDASDEERAQAEQYKDDVTSRAAAERFEQPEDLPDESLPALAAVLAWLEEHELITGPESEKLPPRCAVCHGEVVEEAGWLCSPCFTHHPPEAASSEAEETESAEDAPEVAVAAEMPADESQSEEVAEVAEVAEEEAKPRKRGSSREAAPEVLAPAAEAAPEPASEPAEITIILPDFAQQAVSYVAVSTDDAARLRVEMALHMDRMPHRWQAIYSSTGQDAITSEQYRTGKAMHQTLEHDLTRRMTDASWRQTSYGAWVAPWETEQKS